MLIICLFQLVISVSYVRIVLVLHYFSDCKDTKNIWNGGLFRLRAFAELYVWLNISERSSNYKIIDSFFYIRAWAHRGRYVGVTWA